MRKVSFLFILIALAVLFSAEAWAHPAHWVRPWIPEQGHYESVLVVNGPWSKWEPRWICDIPGHWGKPQLVHEPHLEYPVIIPAPYIPVPGYCQHHRHRHH